MVGVRSVSVRVNCQPKVGAYQRCIVQEGEEEEDGHCVYACLEVAHPWREERGEREREMSVQSEKRNKAEGDGGGEKEREGPGEKRTLTTLFLCLFVFYKSS
jgi:hypothetical protein